MKAHCIRSAIVVCHLVLASIGHAQSRLEAQSADTTQTPLEIKSFAYQLETAYVNSFLAMGVNARAHLFDRLSIGVKLSMDPGDGAIFTIPYFRVEWPNLGGFEVGSLIRPGSTEWVVPYWESWRIWIGRERVFLLSASVLSNVPLNAVGYYDLGIAFGVSEYDHRIWLGLASLDEAKGPACKTQWEIGSHTWLLAGFSHMIGQKPEKLAFSLSVGLKQEF